MNIIRHTLSSLALLTACALPLAGHAATNLVVNGSFEQGAPTDGFTGWTVVAGDPNTYVDSSGHTSLLAGDASDGLWSAYFGTSAAAGGGTISQSLATSANQAYVLTFDFANDNAGADPANYLVVDVAGAQVFAVRNIGDQDYVHETVHFTATGPSTLLSFAASNDAWYLQLDNVGVAAAAVPEPASVELMILGMGMLGGLAAMRRRGG